jgi:hypothetical protein
VVCFNRFWCTYLFASAECACLTSIPRGDLYCTYCQNKFLKEKFVEHNENAVAAGRVSLVDVCYAGNNYSLFLSEIY